MLKHHGNTAEAEKELNISRNAIGKCVRRVRMKAALNGLSPKHDMTHTVPDGFFVRGVSTLYGDDGKMKMQWVKSSADKENYDSLMEAIEVLKEEYRGLSQPIPAPQHTMNNIITVYPLADPHIGLYAWFEETDNDFDVEIAERILTEGVKRAVAVAPPSEEAIVANLGDFFHADNLLNETLRSHNTLDVDTRWPKVLSVGIKIMRAIVENALEKHAKVTLINEIGNHDDHTSVMLTAVMSAYFENNERVDVVTSPMKMHYYQFGKVLFGMTHGDTIKPEMLGQVMAADVPEKWGTTTHRYWLTGHVHTKRVFELPGCTVESFNTLAARDAWTFAKGYRSARSLSCIVYHREYGEIERHVIDITQIEGGD